MYVQELGKVAARARNILPGDDWAPFFPEASGTDRTISSDWVMEDVVQSMRSIVRRTGSQTRDFAAEVRRLYPDFTDIELCQFLWEWMYAHIAYKLDKRGVEQLRQPARTWRDRKSGVDCDCYSIFISSVLSNWGIPHKFRVAQYDADKGPQHVYVVAFCDGQPVVIDPVMDTNDGVSGFNTEEPTRKDWKQDFPAGFSGFGENERAAMLANVKEQAKAMLLKYGKERASKALQKIKDGETLDAGDLVDNKELEAIATQVGTLAVGAGCEAIALLVTGGVGGPACALIGPIAGKLIGGAVGDIFGKKSEDSAARKWANLIADPQPEGLLNLSTNGSRRNNAKNDYDRLTQERADHATLLDLWNLYAEYCDTIEQLGKKLTGYRGKTIDKRFMSYCFWTLFAANRNLETDLEFTGWGNMTHDGTWGNGTNYNPKMVMPDGGELGISDSIIAALVDENNKWHKGWAQKFLDELQKGNKDAERAARLYKTGFMLLMAWLAGARSPDSVADWVKHYEDEYQQLIQDLQNELEDDTLDKRQESNSAETSGWLAAPGVSAALTTAALLII